MGDTAQKGAKLAAFRDAKSYVRQYVEDSASARFYGTRVRLILDMIREHKEGKALDVGCGPGMMARHLIGKSWKVFGLDMSPEMIRECTASLGRSGNFLCGTVDDLPFMDGTFDVVLAMGVLEYAVDGDRAVRELARVTRKGGIVIATMLNKISPYRFWEGTVYRWARLLRAKGVKTHDSINMSLYSEKAFRRLIEASGLEIIDIVYYDFNLFLPPLDRYMPRISAKLNGALESFCGNSLKWPYSGFIVNARMK